VEDGGAATPAADADRISADTPDLAYSKLQPDDMGDPGDPDSTVVPLSPWSNDSDSDDVSGHVTSGGDRDWLERAMKREGLL